MGRGTWRCSHNRIIILKLSRSVESETYIEALVHSTSQLNITAFCCEVTYVSLYCTAPGISYISRLPLNTGCHLPTYALISSTLITFSYETDRRRPGTSVNKLISKIMKERWKQVEENFSVYTIYLSIVW